MSNLEKWIRAILNEDADNLSIGSVRTLQMIKQEFQELQKQNEKYEKALEKIQDEANKSIAYEHFYIIAEQTLRTFK